MDASAFLPGDGQCQRRADAEGVQTDGERRPDLPAGTGHQNPCAS
ncbi:hypothetical protein [Streptomyces sp. NPDC094149]